MDRANMVGSSVSCGLTVTTEVVWQVCGESFYYPSVNGTVMKFLNENVHTIYP